MTIRHNETPGEVPPLPVSVPLVQVWGRSPDSGHMDWITLRSDDWPEGEYPRSVYDQARKVPGTALTFTWDGNRYRVVWSEGSAPAFTSVAPPVASATIPVEQLRADWKPTTTRDHARAAQERLFPVRLDKDGPPTLPEICVYIRNAIRGDNPAVVMPDEELKKVRAALESRRAAWEDSKRDPCGKFPVLFREFETMISNMVIITIGIITEELKLRAECGVNL